MFLSRIRRQLSRTLDADIEPLSQLSGAVGTLFRIRLVSWGYCFVAKGTVAPFKRLLEWESHLYAKYLRPLQGDVVPVCLGVVELAKPYYHLPGTEITHLLAMSYSGKAILIHSPEYYPHTSDHSGFPGGRWRITEAFDRVRERGVRHGDIREENTLWCEETKRVMVVDFDRAEVVSDCKSGDDSGISEAEQEERKRHLWGRGRGGGGRAARRLPERMVRSGVGITVG